jgi:DNA invertase Pin-like site-specific DNA recombinase
MASPAAAYVRMSTDLQKYSTENQLETIRRYAEQRGFEIIKVFEDSGRSGLRIDDRDGLQLLMREVQSGSADFQAILVYDVSRWEGSKMLTRGLIMSTYARGPAFAYITAASSLTTTGR